MHTTAFRLALLLLTQAAFILFLKSDALSRWTGIPLSGRLFYGPTPLLAAAILSVVLLVIIGRDRTGVAWRPWSVRALALAGIAWSAIAAVAIVLAHPPIGWHPPVAADTVELQSVAFAAFRYSVIMLTLVPGVWLLFPPAFIRRYRRSLLCCMAALFGYLWLAALIIALHPYVAPPLLAVCAALLHIIAPQSLSYPRSLMLVNGRFTAVIAPQCLGLDALVLFLCMWPVLWHAASAKRHLDPRRAWLGLLLGAALLASLNCVRIIVLVMIGGFAPETAVSFFHGVLGAVTFFITVVAVLPLLRGRAKEDHRGGDRATLLP